jgi:clan AA aspartic protease
MVAELSLVSEKDRVAAAHWRSCRFLLRLRQVGESTVLDPGRPTGGPPHRRLPPVAMRVRVVPSGREAVMTLTVLGRFPPDPSRGRGVEAVIDTGFTGHLTLPPEVVRSLGLLPQGFVEVELADGTTTALGVFGARVLWRSRQRPVPVYEAGGGPLIGMSLLRGSHPHGGGRTRRRSSSGRGPGLDAPSQRGSHERQQTPPPLWACQPF